MLARLFGTGVLALAITLSTTPPAKANVDFARAILKIAGPIIAYEVGEAIKNLAADPNRPLKKVQIQAAAGEDQLILGKKVFDVQTTHFTAYANNAETLVKLISTVPCEGLYGIKVSEIQCSCRATPQLVVVQVILPKASVYRVIPDYKKQDKDIRTGLLAPHFFVQGSLRKLEAEIPDAVQRLGQEEANKHIEEVNAVARVQLQKALEEQLMKAQNPSGPSFVVVVK